ncbi:Uncharacterized protein HZ326_24159, partial [Fusarium oxysporum f. sp. albedinis]
MGSLSRSSRRRATRNQRQFTPLLQALSQSILVNPHIWQRPLSPQKGSSHICSRGFKLSKQASTSHRK